MNLIQRCQHFLDELGVPTTAFFQRVEISAASFYKWRNGDLRLSDSTLERIDTYLAKYNF